MPSKILTGTELPNRDMSQEDRALTDMFLIEQGAVPKIEPEKPIEIKQPLDTNK